MPNGAREGKGQAGLDGDDPYTHERAQQDNYQDGNDNDNDNIDDSE